MPDIPEEPTPEQIRALVETCPRTVTITRPGPWGSTVYLSIPLGSRRWEPDWEALLPDPVIADPGPSEERNYLPPPVDGTTTPNPLR